MNIRKMIIGCTALLLGANVAWALDGDEAESTIRLMGAAEAELPEAVKADEARERNADMAGEAQKNRESHGRPEDRPGPPADPGRPDRE